MHERGMWGVGRVAAVVFLCAYGRISWADISPTEPANAKQISQLTGPVSQNNTVAKWQLVGTDVGAMWDAGSCPKVNQPCMIMAFGDTFSACTFSPENWSNPCQCVATQVYVCTEGGVGNRQWHENNPSWRASVLAYSTDRTPSDGITFDAMSTPNHTTGRNARCIERRIQRRRGLE